MIVSIAIVRTPRPAGVCNADLGVPTMTERIRDFLTRRRPEGPCLVVDLDVVRTNYETSTTYAIMPPSPILTTPTMIPAEAHARATDIMFFEP